MPYPLLETWYAGADSAGSSLQFLEVPILHPLILDTSSVHFIPRFMFNFPVQSRLKCGQIPKSKRFLAKIFTGTFSLMVPGKIVLPTHLPIALLPN